MVTLPSTTSNGSVGTIAVSPPGGVTSDQRAVREPHMAASGSR